MYSLFPDWLTTSTADLDALFSGVKMKLTILVKNPEFSDTDDPGTGSTAHITSVSLLQDLLDDPAWQDLNNATYTAQNWADPTQETLPVGVADSGGTSAPVPGVSRFLTVENGYYLYWPLGGPAVATGFILSINDTGSAHDGQVVMIFRPEFSVYLTGESEDVSSRIGAASHLFSYGEVDAGGDRSHGWNFLPGDLSVIVPAVQWETSRCAHVWIDPQRINYVTNPSFRFSPNVHGWRSNATMTQDSGGISRSGLSNCAHLSGPSDIVLESNFFPTKSITETWCVSAEVSGAGRFRVGIVFFPPSMDPAAALYIHTPWHTFDATVDAPLGSSDQSSFHRLFASLPAPDTTKEACVRIEFEDAGSSGCWVDEVFAGPEDGPGTYFDAAWPLGQPADYTWYGGFANKSYSLFYNDRTNLKSLMFGYLVDPPVEGQPPRYSGEVEKWVPEGVNVVAHWNDVFSTRIHTWMEDVIIPPKDFTDRTVVTDLT